MDRNFIKLMCESFYNDFELRKTHIWLAKPDAISELNTEICNIVENLKSEDIELYTELFTYSRQKQYSIIYELLAEYIVETFSEDVLEDVDLSESIVVPLSLFGLGAIVALKGGTQPVSRAKIAVLEKLNNATMNIAKTIKKWTAKSRVTKAILYSNTGDCLRRCGLKSTKDLKKFSITLQHYGVLGTKEGSRQVHCLTECYLTTNLEMICELGIAYRECLIANGQMVNNMTFAEIVASCPVSFCKVFYDQITSHRSVFSEAIDVIYDGDAAKIAKFMGKYDESLSIGLKGNRVNLKYDRFEFDRK